MVETKKKLVPELRFPEFSNEWKIKTIQLMIDEKIILGHLDGNHGELYPKSDEFSVEGIPYISANDLDGQKVNLATSKRIPISRAKKFKKGISKNGDVLFAHNATVGPSGILKTNFDFVILSTTVTYFRCDTSRLDNFFLLNSLNAVYFVKQYSRVMSQSTRNQVPITMQRKFYLQWPEIKEQQKIAAFLSAVDDKLTNLRRKRELLESYKRGLMQQLFSQQIRFKRDDGSDFPDWEEKKLGELLKIGSGRDYKHLDAGDIPVYGTGGLMLKVNDFLYDGESVCIGRKGTIDKPYFLSGKFWTVDTLFYTHSFKDIIPRFVFAIFQQINWQSHNEASGVPSLSKSTIEKILVSKPCLLEQQKIADFLQSVDKKIDAVAEQITQLDTFKKGLLQKLFV